MKLFQGFVEDEGHICWINMLDSPGGGLESRATVPSRIPFPSVMGRKGLLTHC